MSEESKTPDSDYVHKGDGAGIVPGGAVKLPVGFDDPNLSQEDRDMRLALALQQQENAAAYDAHKKKHDAAVAAHNLRTARSNTQTRLTDIRRKDHGMLSVPSEYSTENAYVSGGDGGDYASPGVDLTGASPQVIADHNMAANLQKVEQLAAGTGQALEKMIHEEHDDAEAQEHRTTRSKCTL
jgi:hypothetical protein